MTAISLEICKHIFLYACNLQSTQDSKGHCRHLNIQPIGASPSNIFCKTFSSGQLPVQASSAAFVWSCHQFLLNLCRLKEAFLIEGDRLVCQRCGSTMVGPEPNFGIWSSTVKSTLKNKIAGIHGSERRNFNS